MLDEPVLIESISQITALVSSLSVTIAAFVIAKRYKGSVVFGKAYLTLGIAYFAIFLAEVKRYSKLTLL